MTFYPNAIDDDASIVRIDDNLSTLGTLAINQLRSAVFAIEKELGITPSGSKSSVDDRISVSLNEDGTLKSSALETAGLVSLPIVNSHIATNAGIAESKLDLNVDTLTLQAQINSINTVVNNTAVLAAETNTDLLGHIAGVTLLSDGATAGRHVASQIDLNSVPSDIRDVTYVWTGLLDKDGAARSATHVAEGLLQVNDALTLHENLLAGAHPASAITVDTGDWVEIPNDTASVQEALDFLDNREALQAGLDRATLNSNGIPRNARVERLDLDGYNIEVLPDTRVRAYLAEPTQTMPRDSIANGDDIINFLPEDNSGFAFDSLFTAVQVGDIVRIDYGSGVAGQFRVRSIRFNPGVEWTIRIDGTNLVNRDGDADGYAVARIDRKQHDTRTEGVLAVAAAVADVMPDGACANDAPGSVIIGSPRGARALGLGFDVGALNANHYNLWLRLYPNGDPDVFVDLFPIDVTGNAGATPGAYSLDKIVEETNKGFRAAGYNYRFIAFQHDGEFGVMLADAWNGAAFSIVTGLTNGTSIDEDVYVKNVVGDATDGYDALGFGSSRAIVASPVTNGFANALEAANLSTIIHYPVRGRDYIANGARLDLLSAKDSATADGYWEATIATNFTDIPNGTITTTYRVSQVLFSDELKPGKTLVVQPKVVTSDVTGYGRFIIGDVIFNEADGYTDILVINSSHASGDPLGSVLPVDTAVNLFFTEDSVTFNSNNLQGQGTYHRYHEVYVDGSARTHAVERARMIKQSADGAKINTDRDNWQIRNVSSKLLGYRVDDTFRRWLRFYVINYNATTGEFDGYVGEPSSLAGTGVINPGPLTTGTKNRPVRFYDRNNIDFVDIEFKELTVDPGTTVASPPQYIDIEVFPSFSTNDEEMRLAGVSHNESVVGSITDLREFGTLSEENFTDSAMSFIEAGERYLHTNGIVRGFSFLGSGGNAAELSFSGGIGLVNGSFVATGNLICTIPEIRDSTATLNFFVCLTKDGTLRAIPENIGTEFFDNATGEFIESFTFTDIVDNHKEFLILYVANITVGSLILNSTTDARRFVTNESTNGFSLSVGRAGEPELNNASFHTFEAIENWVSFYGIKQVQVQSVFVDSAASMNLGTDLCTLTGGTWTIEDTLTTQGVVFENAAIVITSLNGINLTTTAVLQGCSVSYNPTLTPAFSAGDKVNINAGVHDGYHAISIGSFVDIKDCTFTSASAQRAPFIFYDSAGTTITDVNIIGNTFTDTTATDNSAVCFNTLSGDSKAINVRIENNNCQDHNIILSGDVASTNGWKFINVNISGNNCGVIGYYPNGVPEGTIVPNLEIVGNTCDLIATSNTSFGTHHLTPPGTMQNDLGTGRVAILNNNITGMIWAQVSGSAASPIYTGTIIIQNNTIHVQRTTTVDGWGVGLLVITRGVTVQSVDSGGDTSNMFADISNNKIYFDVDGPASNGSDDLNGVYTNINCNVLDNFLWIQPGLSGWDTANTRLIWTNPHASNDGYTIVSGNLIHRNGMTITNYIRTGSFDSTIITDNVIDSHLVNDSSSTSWTTAIVADASTGAIVQRNKNHRESVTFNYNGRGMFADSSNHPMGGPAAAFANVNQINLGGPGNDLNVHIETSGTGSVKWFLALIPELPSGVTNFVSVSIDISVASTGDWTGAVFPTLVLRKEVDQAYSTTDSVDITSVTSGTLLVSDFMSMAERPVIEFIVRGTRSAAPDIAITAEQVIVTYQW